MKNKTTIEEFKSTESQRDKKPSRRKGSASKKAEILSVHEKLSAEGQEDFYTYLEWLGLAKKKDLIILTSSHHYYFEVEDLINVKVVVNLNQLNKIKKIRDFLYSVNNVLPYKCHFIGCFTAVKNQNDSLNPKKSLHQIDKNGYMDETDEKPWNSFLNMLYGLIDSKANSSFSKKTVQFMLEDTGLKILDMTEFNGLTYFCTQKVKLSVE
jgi:hypothetical protein